MLFSVPSGMSFRGWGTVTMPTFVGCLKCWCEPLVRARAHPSARSLRITSAEVTSEYYNLRVVSQGDPALADVSAGAARADAKTGRRAAARNMATSEQRGSAPLTTGDEPRGGLASEASLPTTSDSIAEFGGASMVRLLRLSCSVGT